MLALDYTFIRVHHLCLSTLSRSIGLPALRTADSSHITCPASFGSDQRHFDTSVGVYYSMRIKFDYILDGPARSAAPISSTNAKFWDVVSFFWHVHGFFAGS
jgi:hypothetical protein